MWDLKCIASALCFLTSNVLFLVRGYLAAYSNAHAQSVMADKNGDASSSVASGGTNAGMDYNYEHWMELDPTYLQNKWMERESHRPLVISASLLGALAWFWMIGPIVQSAWVLSRGFKRDLGPHVLLVAMAVCGGIIELLARLLVAGMTNASLWLSKDFNLNDWDDGDVMGTGWRVLEMIHIVTAGMLLWIDAFESLAILGIVSIMFYSVEMEPRFASRPMDGNDASTSSPSPIVVEEDDGGGSYPSSAGTTVDAAKGTMSKVSVESTFSGGFVTYGLLVGLLALLDFVADVLRFVDWSLFGRMERAMNVALGCIFLPLWLLCLARELPRATERYEIEEGRARTIVNSVANGERTALIRNEGEIM